MCTECIISCSLQNRAVPHCRSAHTACTSQLSCVPTRSIPALCGGVDSRAGSQGLSFPPAEEMATHPPHGVVTVKAQLSRNYSESPTLSEGSLSGHECQPGLSSSQVGFSAVSLLVSPDSSRVVVMCVGALESCRRASVAAPPALHYLQWTGAPCWWLWVFPFQLSPPSWYYRSTGKDLSLDAFLISFVTCFP